MTNVRKKGRRLHLCNLRSETKYSLNLPDKQEIRTLLRSEQSSDFYALVETDRLELSKPTLVRLLPFSALLNLRSTTFEPRTFSQQKSTPDGVLFCWWRLTGSKNKIWQFLLQLCRYFAIFSAFQNFFIVFSPYSFANFRWFKGKNKGKNQDLIYV